MDTLQIKADNEPIKIRGHHLKDLFKGETREEIAKRLVAGKYVSSVEHPFVDVIFNLPLILTNPAREFVVVAGEIDYVCSRCPIFKEKGTRACLGEYTREVDEYWANCLGFEVGKQYTNKEFSEILYRKPWINSSKKDF